MSNYLIMINYNIHYLEREGKKMDRKYVLLVLAVLAASLFIVGCAIQPAPSGGGNETPITGGLVTVQPETEELEKPAGVVESGTGDYFAKITVNEGELIKLDLDATDPDGDRLSYKFSTPLNERGEWQTKIGDAGNYPATITVSDGSLETAKKILIVVKAVNKKPMIEPVEDITITEGQKLVLNLKATDPEDDILVWKYEEPIGADGTWQTEAGDMGDYVIKATVSDGYLSDSTSFKVKVLKLNRPPTLDIERDITVKEGETIKLMPEVSDADGDQVTVSYSGWMNSDTYTVNYADEGKHKVVVSASDGKSEEAVVVWITVTDVNRAPEIHGLIVK